MTEKSKLTRQNSGVKPGDYCELPERHAGHFSNHQDPGIVVDFEVQMGDPVDSQFIRAFMGEFEAASRKRSA